MVLSVITISKNDPAGLEKTLQSIAGLTDIETIVVLGDNHPRSQAIAQAHGCLVLADSGQGIAHAFNVGLAKASGLAVLFLNGGDSLIGPDVVSMSLTQMGNDDQLEIMMYDAVFDDALIGKYLYRAAVVEANHLPRIGLGMPCSHQAMVVRRTCFETLGPFNPRYRVAMDYEWLCRWQARSRRQSVRTGRIKTVAMPPVVCVDGHGISIAQEPRCLYECVLALWENGLLLGLPLVDYLNRWMRFALRYSLSALGLTAVVATVKQRLHNPVP